MSVAPAIAGLDRGALLALCDGGPLLVLADEKGKPIWGAP